MRRLLFGQPTGRRGEDECAGGEVDCDDMTFQARRERLTLLKQPSLRLAPPLGRVPADYLPV
jgi:hypothetical protein